MIYNIVIFKLNVVEEAWSSIDVQLKKRADLIPNLVNVVKGYSTFEKEAFKSISKIRSAIYTDESHTKKLKKEDRIDYEIDLTMGLKNILFLSENYPELKSNKLFMKLQNELVVIESYISAARRAYNSAANDYNIIIDYFPINLIAGIFNFKKVPYFTLVEDENSN